MWDTFLVRTVSVQLSLLNSVQVFINALSCLCSVLEGFYWLLACLLVIYELAEQVRELRILGKHLRGDLVLVRVAAAWPRPAALQQLHHLQPPRRAERVEPRPGLLPLIETIKTWKAYGNNPPAQYGGPPGRGR